MQKKRWLVLAGFVGALLSLAMLVAACDDDDDNGDGNVPATEPAATEPAPVDGTPQAGAELG